MRHQPHTLLKCDCDFCQANRRATWLALGILTVFAVCCVAGAGALSLTDWTVVPGARY